MTFSELYFSFKGRISRKTYWVNVFLPLFLINIIVSVIDGALRFDGVLTIIVRFYWFGQVLQLLLNDGMIGINLHGGFLLS